MIIEKVWKSSAKDCKPAMLIRLIRCVNKSFKKEEISEWEDAGDEWKQ